MTRMLATQRSYNGWLLLRQGYVWGCGREAESPFAGAKGRSFAERKTTILPPSIAIPSVGKALVAFSILCAGCEIRDAAPLPDASEAATDLTGGRAIAHDPLSQGRIAFVDGFESGRQMARDEQKPMLLFFTAEWCKYCQQMAHDTLVREAVVELSRNFVCVRVDADAEPEVCRQFEVRGFPTIQFVSPRGVRLNRLTGNQPARMLIAQMNAALHAMTRRSDAALPR